MRYLLFAFILLFLWSALIIYFFTENNAEINAAVSPHEEAYIKGPRPVEAAHMSEESGEYKYNQYEPDFYIPVYIYVYMAETGETIRYNFEQYLVGVVLAEMPASFELEALKAQAVAARSYCLFTMLYSNDERRRAHNGADVCSNPAHCKAHISIEQAQKRWGGYNAELLAARIREAVSATAGEIITYDGRVVNALFHASSAGRTEYAANVWGSHISYLSAVETIESAETNRNFLSTAVFTPAEFRNRLVWNGFAPVLGENPGEWVSDVVNNSSNRVDHTIIGGIEISGVRMRAVFGLRSASFCLEYREGAFIFNVRGHGHGVGMSQYGANAMALAGYSYEQILKHFYPGVELTRG